MMSTVKLAVAGAGLIGKAHIERIRDCAAAELVAIIDPGTAGYELALRADCPHFNDLPSALARLPELQGVVLATPNQLHVEQAQMCIDYGCAALIEKPVADQLDAGRELLRHAEKAAADGHCPALLVGHHRVHSAIMARAREVIESGVLGEPVAIQGSALFFKPDHYFVEGPWRTQPGGGPILLNLIHEIGNLRTLCGEITEVHAFTSNQRRQFAVEDTAAISLRFANGTLGTFLLSDTAASARSWEQTARENPSYASYPDEDCYHLAGTLGSLSIPSMRIKRYADQADRSWWQPFIEELAAFALTDPLVSQIEHFCAVIRGEEQPRVSLRDGLINLLVTEAISAAAASGKPQQIDLSALRFSAAG